MTLAFEREKEMCLRLKGRSSPYLAFEGRRRKVIGSGSCCGYIESCCDK